MKSVIGSVAVGSALVLVATALGTSVVQADPDTVIHYATSVQGERTVVTSVDTGRFQLAGDVVQLVDNDGTLMGALPMQYSWDGIVYPIAAEITDDGRAVEMTPTDLPTMVSQVVQRDRGAEWGNLVQAAGQWWNSGGMMTVAVGATIGQVVGCVAILLNPIAGCILGTIIGAGIGAAVGIVRDGSENLQPAMFEFFSTFQP